MSESNNGWSRVPRSVANRGSVAGGGGGMGGGGELRSHGNPLTRVRLPHPAKINLKWLQLELSDEKFQELALDAKANCPISKLLNTDITLNAVLKG